MIAYYIYEALLDLKWLIMMLGVCTSALSLQPFSVSNLFWLFVAARDASLLANIDLQFNGETELRYLFMGRALWLFLWFSYELSRLEEP